MSEPPHFAAVRSHLDGFEAELFEGTPTGMARGGADSEALAPLPGTPEPPD